MSLDVFHLSHACSLLIKPYYSRRHQCASINMFRWMEEWNTKAWMQSTIVLDIVIVLKSHSCKTCLSCRHLALKCIWTIKIQSKSSTTAEEQLSSSRHCSNQQGWVMQLIGVRQVFEQPVQADRNNWNWPFLVHQMLSMRPGVQTHSDVVDFSWAVLNLFLFKNVQSEK